MLEVLFDAIITLLAVRAIWKLLRGSLKVGVSSGPADPRQAPPQAPPAEGVHMEKDPVCGTYVVPDRSVSLSIGRQTMYFCSTACRDKYQAKTA